MATVKTIDAQTIGERLRTLRGSRTQKEVGDAIGVTAMAISFYERGERVPADDIKVALARYFNSTVEAIFFGSKLYLGVEFRTFLIFDIKIGIGVTLSYN